MDNPEEPKAPQYAVDLPTMESLCGYMPKVLIVCAVLVLPVPFIHGCNPSAGPEEQNWLSVGAGFFFGPLLLGIAAILHRLNQLRGR